MTPAAPPLPLVRFRHVRKSYGGGAPAVRDLSLEVAPGEFLTLLGPSGSGKTTTLMLLAGFERPDAGEILLEERPIARTPPHRRGIGVVFQNSSLFPHLTVAGNVAFPLRVRGVPRAEQQDRVARALDMVQLAGLEDRLPARLSGGQQQRAALARALVFQPRLVLLDEPLGALDRQLREQVQLEIRDLHKRLGVTMIYVTHDQAEAIALSDRIAVFAAGAVQQLGTPQQLYDDPTSAFVAGFLGENNRLPGYIDKIEDDLALVQLDCGPTVEARLADAEEGETCVVSVRPERIAVAAVTAAEMGEGALPATVTETIFHGDHIRLRLEVGLPGSPPAPITVKRPAGVPMVGLEPGQPAAIAWQPYHAQALPAGTGRLMSETQPQPARMEVADRTGSRVLSFRGALDTTAAGLLWPAAMQAAALGRGRPMVLDLSGLTFCDTTGVALLLEAERVHGPGVTNTGAGEQVAELLARIRSVPPASPRPPVADTPWTQSFVGGLRAARDGVAFLGEVTLAIVRLPSRARMFRGPDLLRAVEQAGVQAMPLVLLLGTLIGLILAFQSLIPMRRFGADLYVADLVSIGLIRELGPLLAAVILAGRTGSAFAAEIGTMKVNQELEALVTMDVDPITMLVLPRLAAVVVVMPVLAIMLDIAGLLGMALVLVSGGIPIQAIAARVAYQVVPSDLYGGLFKAMVFGAAIANIGCRSGMSTGVGPRAVGVSATAAVVGGIVATIALDGLLAVVFFRLGI